MSPLSVVFVGVGNGDFGSIRSLATDSEYLMDQFQRRAARHLVHFVKFNDYFDAGMFSLEAMSKLPFQVTSTAHGTRTITVTEQRDRTA
jgi:hypothetical protein